MAFLYILLKTGITRKYLDDQLGKDYIIQIFGKNSGKKLFLRSCAVVATAVGAEIAAQSLQRAQNNNTADLFEQKQNELWKSSGYEPSLGEKQKLLDNFIDLRNMPCEGLNILSQIFKIQEEKKANKPKD